MREAQGLSSQRRKERGCVEDSERASVGDGAPGQVASQTRDPKSHTAQHRTPSPAKSGHHTGPFVSVSRPPDPLALSGWEHPGRKECPS